jgi:alanyl-tRNA synthetase
MIMTRRKLYSKVGWRKYLDPTDRPRVRNFLEKNGKLVFRQVVQCIQTATERGDKEIAILVHPNVQSIVVIEENDYNEILTHSLQFFKSIIVKLKKQINDTIKTDLIVVDAS